MVLAPGPLMWPLLATHLAALVAEGVLLSVVRRDWTLWRAVYATALETPFREFHELHALRNRVQADAYRRRTRMVQDVTVAVAKAGTTAAAWYATVAMIDQGGGRPDPRKR